MRGSVAMAAEACFYSPHTMRLSGPSSNCAAKNSSIAIPPNNKPKDRRGPGRGTGSRATAARGKRRRKRRRRRVGRVRMAEIAIL